MKVAIITDTHFGARNDSELFLDYFLDFFEKDFFPYLDENNITKVLHLGDVFDRRKYININTLSKVRDTFVEFFTSRDIELHCILGNHDTYYRNTNKVNSLKELLKDKENIFIHETPKILKFNGLSLGMIPWINKENFESSVEFIKNANVPIVCGHFELTGYQVLPGVRHFDGMDPEILENFEMVLSGHFHCKHNENNVHYLGTPYEITFADMNQNKGFHILDTETRELEFIQNKNQMFYSIKYADEFDENKNFDYLKNKYVKIFIESKSDPSVFERLMDKLNNLPVANVTIVEDISGIEVDGEEKIDMQKDTVSLINDEIDALGDIKNPDKLKKIISELYIESLSV